jgi:hypothetical protein
LFGAGLTDAEENVRTITAQAIAALACLANAKHWAQLGGQSS